MYIHAAVLVSLHASHPAKEGRFSRHGRDWARSQSETRHTQIHDQKNITNDHTKDHPPSLKTESGCGQRGGLAFDGVWIGKDFMYLYTSG